MSQVQVGITLLLMRNFNLALKVFLDALSIRKNVLGEQHLSNARIYNNIGCVHIGLNELRNARGAFENALDIQRNALSNDQKSKNLMIGVSTTLCNLGYLHRCLKMHQNVAVVLEEALDLQQRVLSQTHPTILATIDNLANAFLWSGKYSLAIRYYSKIILLLKKMDDTPMKFQAKAVTFYKISRAYRKQNKIEEELDKLRNVLQAVRGVNVGTEAEKNNRNQFEFHILNVIRRSREDLNKLH